MCFICKVKLRSLVNDWFKLWITLLLRVLHCKKTSNGESLTVQFLRKWWQIKYRYQDFAYKFTLTNMILQILFLVKITLCEEERMCLYLNRGLSESNTSPASNWDENISGISFQHQTAATEPKLCCNAGAALCCFCSLFQGLLFRAMLERMLAAFLKIFLVYIKLVMKLSKLVCIQ